MCHSVSFHDNINNYIPSAIIIFDSSVVVQELLRPYRALDKGIHPYNSLDNPTDNSSALRYAIRAKNQPFSSPEVCLSFFQFRSAISDIGVTCPY
jgi:hypothetical protein